MNKKLIREIAALKKKAKENSGRIEKFKIAQPHSSSLHAVIKTREQADTFMAILKSL
ncbi:hypothetical protein [Chitinophaga caseinilytica]|uniref:hypothetical protein n=1 Tax=Chitinophaga caseinilytica TaxID=2267521 RepID=UPI003C2E4E1F